MKVIKNCFTGDFMVSCKLTKTYVPIDQCIFCDYCKGSFIESNKRIALCTFSRTSK